MNEFMTNEKILAFIEGKLKEAESSLRGREEMKMVWRSGTNATWSAACDLHPSTSGKAMSKSERLKTADRHERIALKLSHEVEMFKAALGIISNHLASTKPNEDK